MADFRGVSKQAVLDSFVRASLFLRQSNLGQHTTEVLENWDKNGATTKIGAARNDKQMVEAMKESGALSSLSYYQDLFMYHAATERADGNDTQMQDLYRDLMAWSAFFNVSVSSNPDIGKEVRTHIVVDLLNRMAAAGIDSESCREKLSDAVGEVEKKDKKLAEWLDSALPVTQLLYGAADASEFRQWLGGPSSNQGSCLQRTLYSVSNLPSEETVNAVPKAMEKYSVILSNQPDSTRVMPKNQWDSHVETVKKNFQIAMARFVEIAQTAKIDIKPLTQNRDKWGISFYGTLGAAQGAAASLRAYNLSVVDPQGRIIEPPPQKLLTGPSNPGP
jgi:hypothetical protein